MRARYRRYASLVLAGMAVAVVLSAAALAIVTRTDWGRERVLAFTLSALGGRLNGTLVVERLGGNVLTGARLYGVSLSDPDGEPLIVADSAYIEYNLATFVGGDVVIRRLDVHDPEVHLARLPGDSLWNYQVILQDTAQRTGGGPGRATLIQSLRLVDGDVTVRMSWEPDPGLSEREREREVETALADPSRVRVERVPGGFARTMRFRVERGVVSDLSIAPDERGGTTLRVDSLTADAFLYREPALRLEQVQGELALREGVLRYRAPSLVLPGSRLASVGVVDVAGEEGLAYDVQVRGDTVALADLHWLFPTLPEEGGGEGTLWLETRPGGLMVLARGLSVSAPGTELQGDFGMILGDTLRFLESDLRAEPLDVETVERLLPAGLPVEGLRIGAVEIRAGS